MEKHYDDMIQEKVVTLDDLMRLPLGEFCERHQIRKMLAFGSILRDDFRGDSDIDILVEFEPSRTVTFFDMVDMQNELNQLLGREVDFLTAGFLSAQFRDRVLKTAHVIYERA